MKVCETIVKVCPKLLVMLFYLCLAISQFNSLSRVFGVSNVQGIQKADVCITTLHALYNLKTVLPYPIYTDFGVIIIKHWIGSF